MFIFAAQLSLQSFMTKVSDPSFGGTYITLLTMVNAFGIKWPSTVALQMVEVLTWKTCTPVGSSIHEVIFLMLENTKMNSDINLLAFVSWGHLLIVLKNDFIFQPVEVCRTLDGYYVEVLFGIVFNVVWIQCWAKKIAEKLQKLEPSAWWIGNH